MGLRYITSDDKTALYDSVTEWAFGPVFNTEHAADQFLDWLQAQGVRDGDARSLSTPDLVTLWESYCAETENPYG